MEAEWRWWGIRQSGRDEMGVTWVGWNVMQWSHTHTISTIIAYSIVHRRYVF